ncbi:MAG: polyribonucleotide nucleotidyltransferase [Candidatus Doudnabacteria bacterium]|nr:polyribonucleotide nucleotidyltransferase [Candidatus Doudnabacteria bacterium]
MSQKVNKEIAGKPFSLETGVLAQQANGAVVGTLGETVVLATAVMNKQPREGIDFFPLLVDYEEKLYAVGKIKGSRFIKREGRPTDEAVLSGRLVDRGLRPLFPEGMRNDVQVMLSIFSVDEVNDPDVVGINAASSALMISDIPFAGPLAAVRVGRVNGQLVINPSYEERVTGDLDLVVAGTENHIMMIEAGAKVVSEEVIIDAVTKAQAQIRDLVELQKQLVKLAGRPKAPVTIFRPEAALEKKVSDFCSTPLQEALYLKSKVEREAALAKLKEQMLEKLEKDGVRVSDSDDFKEVKKQAADAFYSLQKKIVRAGILAQDKRIDARPLDQTRPVTAQAGILPRTHGSAIFNRGETQVLTTVTLGSTGDAQILDGMEDFEETKKRYMHHYNMPGFSVGEVAPVRGAGRREIGHGALAERALEPVLPDKEKFPYTMRLVSEVLSSNGSTSMAATCGSSLALMDAGVPIAGQVGGVAMGLVLDVASGKFRVLTDIQGTEDFFGDMDFKVAGPRNGVTAMQMDIKTLGLTVAILEQALVQAKTARMHILQVMDSVLAQPRPELSKHAPRIESFRIDPKKIRDVIGTGGKIINEIIEVTGVKIDIEDDGLVAVTSKDPEGMRKAVEWIQNLVREVAPGEVFDGKVTRIMDFGAFVEVLPGKEGLVHISEIAPYRINRVEDAVQLGDTVKVVCTEIDSMGRINLSMKALGAAPGGVGGPARGGRPRLDDHLYNSGGRGGRGFDRGDRGRHGGRGRGRGR